MTIQEVSDVIADIDSRFLDAGYEGVGALLNPAAPGESVTLSAYITPADLVFQRLVLSAGIKPEDIEREVASFRRQLLIRNTGHTTGVLTFVFDGPPGREFTDAVKSVSHSATDEGNGTVNIYVGAFDAARRRYAVFNKQPVGLIAQELYDYVEGSGKKKERPGPQPAARIPKDQQQVLLALIGRRKSVFLVWAILVVNVTVFLMMMASGGGDLTAKLVRFGASFGPGIAQGEIWRLFTCMFLHVTPLHILFNSYVLFIMGRDAEAFFGSLRFAVIYIASGLAGSIASVSMNPKVVSAGASGAIFGLGGALIAYTLLNRDALPARFAKSWLKNLLVFVGLNLFIGMSVPQIDNWAHMGGLVGGFLFGMAVAPVFQTERKYSLLRELAVIPLVMILAFAGYNAQRVAGGKLKVVAPVAEARQEVANLYRSVIATTMGKIPESGSLVANVATMTADQQKAMLNRAAEETDFVLEVIGGTHPESSEGKALLDAYKRLVQARRNSYEVVLKALTEGAALDSPEIAETQKTEKDEYVFYIRTFAQSLAKLGLKLEKK